MLPIVILEKMLAELRRIESGRLVRHHQCKHILAVFLDCLQSIPNMLLFYHVHMHTNEYDSVELLVVRLWTVSWCQKCIAKWKKLPTSRCIPTDAKRGLRLLSSKKPDLVHSSYFGDDKTGTCHAMCTKLHPIHAQAAYSGSGRSWRFVRNNKSPFQFAMQMRLPHAAI